MQVTKVTDMSIPMISNVHVSPKIEALHREVQLQ
jgi:hypothetical protein